MAGQEEGKEEEVAGVGKFRTEAGAEPEPKLQEAWVSEDNELIRSNSDK